jgi:hypothetical protein
MPRCVDTDAPRGRGEPVPALPNSGDLRESTRWRFVLVLCLPKRSTCRRTLREHFLDHFAVHVGEATVEAVVAEC